MKIIKYISIVLSAGMLSACGNDWLDMEPTTSVNTETSLNTLKDFEFTLNGIYSTMQSYYYYGARMQYYGDVTGDDVQAYSATKRCADYYSFSYNASNVPSTFWRTCYAIIRDANIILTRIDKIETPEEDEDYRDDLKGQALTVRALALFDLTRLYGYPYLKDNGASLGVPIVEEVVEINYLPKRSTVADCYKRIIGDLETAVPLLSGKRTEGKINRWAAMTLLSRAYLYKGDNQQAFNTATEGIKGAEKSGFKLWSNEEYQNAWSEAFSSEVFFEVVNLLTDSPGKESMGYLCAPKGKGYYDMILTSSFVDFLKKRPKDVRSKMYEISSKRAYILKYPGERGDGGPSDANIRVFRLSELYLNAAEAAQKLNDNDNAVKYLDPIVKRGNPDNTVVGQSITLERVLEERRLEFFGEGQRMFDVIRNGMKIKREDVSLKELSSTKHLSLQSYAKEFDWNMFKVVLAIPKAELDANPNMAGQQNPNY